MRTKHGRKIQQQNENFGKNKNKKNLKKNCWEVVWPPLGLCRGGGGGVPCGLCGAVWRRFPQTPVLLPMSGFAHGETACKTDGNDRLAVLAARAAGKRARAFQKKGCAGRTGGQMAASVRARRAGKLRREVLKSVKRKKRPLY